MSCSMAGGASNLRELSVSAGASECVVSAPLPAVISRVVIGEFQFPNGAAAAAAAAHCAAESDVAMWWSLREEAARRGGGSMHRAGNRWRNAGWARRIRPAL